MVNQADKKSDRKGDSKRGTQVQRIDTVKNPDGGSPLAFIAIIGLIVAAGIAAVVFFAVNRESNIDVAPLAGVDHWHSAFLINDCGEDLPATGQFENPAGLHTHGDGLLHLHPFNPAAAGANATLGTYLAGNDSELTDESFTTGFTDPFPTTMSEADGCNGEPAVLQLAVWRDAFDEDAEPEIFTENLADYRFESGGEAITLALLPEGAEIPKPGPDRLAALAQSGPGSAVDGADTGADGGDGGAVDTDPETDAESNAPEADADADTEDESGS